MRARRGGEWLVRIEDVDVPRTRAGAEGAILATLERYGFAGTAPSSASRSARRSTRRRSSSSPPAARLRVRLHAARAGARAAPAPAASASIPAPAATAFPRSGSAQRRGACRVRVGEPRIECRDRLQGAQAQDLARDVGDFVVRRADGFSRISSPSSSTTRCKASRTSCAAPICSRRRRGRSSCSGGSARDAVVSARADRDQRAGGEKLSKQTHAAPLARRRRCRRLLAAWRFLDQPAAHGARAPASVAEFWAWAIARGTPARLPPVPMLPAPAGVAAEARRRGYNLGPASLSDGTRAIAVAVRAESPPMTTLVVVRKNDEIAIAADSLTTFGDTRLVRRSSTARPTRSSTTSGTYIGLCGSAAHQLVFESLLAKHTRPRLLRQGRDLRDVPQAASDPEGAALPQSEGGGGRPVRVDADHRARSPTGTASSACTRCARCSSTRSSGRSGSGREFALGAMHAQYARLNTAEAIAARRHRGRRDVRQEFRRCR